MWHRNRSTLGIFPDEMATACAVVPEFCIFEDAFDLFVIQGLHRETFSPSPKSMPSVTSTRYWRSSASFPPSVKHSGCPRTSARYLLPSRVTSATKCSPCVSNSMTDGTGRTVSPHGLPRVDTTNTSVFAKASSRLIPYRCNLRPARRARSRSIVKVLSSVCMICILPYSGLSVWRKCNAGHSKNPVCEGCGLMEMTRRKKLTVAVRPVSSLGTKGKSTSTTFRV